MNNNVKFAFTTNSIPSNADKDMIIFDVTNKLIGAQGNIFNCPDVVESSSTTPITNIDDISTYTGNVVIKASDLYTLLKGIETRIETLENA